MVWHLWCRLLEHQDHWLYIILRLPRGGGFNLVLTAAFCCRRLCSFCKRCSSLTISMHSRPVSLSSLRCRPRLDGHSSRRIG